jgi:hypothetical protein
MRNRYILGLITLAMVLFSCERDKVPPVVPPPAQPVLLKDIVVNNLPSPYYRFEYNSAGKVTRTTFSAGLMAYEVVYSNGHISELRNISGANNDRLVYIYNNQGYVDLIKYITKTGVLYKICYMTYNGTQLQKMEWEHKLPAGFILDRTLTFMYQADGNLLEMTDHRPLIPGEQPEATHIDRFEQYDTKINTDGFSLVHQNIDHLLLLPGVQLQKNNAQKLIRTGTGNTYTIDYTYTYNDKNTPLTKSGDAVFTSGPNNGQRFQVNTVFTYY